MKMPRQTQITYEQDFGSFNVSLRSCDRPEVRMKQPIQT